jgi:transcriptional antiterminator RfaH
MNHSKKSSNGYLNQTTESHNSDLKNAEFADCGATKDSSAEWYLAAAKPKQEIRAVEHLKNQGIECYCPLIQVERLLRGKKIIKQEALFSGYLFIYLSTQDPNWHKVRSTRGIRDWVRFAGNVAKCPAELVEQLIDIDNSSQNRVINRIEPGESVRILSGPFAGLAAVFEKEDGERRAMILVEFLGKTNRVIVDNQQIVVD